MLNRLLTLGLSGLVITFITLTILHGINFIFNVNIIPETFGSSFLITVAIFVIFAVVTYLLDMKESDLSNNSPESKVETEIDNITRAFRKTLTQAMGYPGIKKYTIEIDKREHIGVGYYYDLSVKGHDNHEQSDEPES